MQAIHVLAPNMMREVCIIFHWKSNISILQLNKTVQ